MRLELIPLTGYETSDDPIELEDYSSGQFSEAIYQANNPGRKTFIIFKPDEAHGREPRCDYMLAAKDDSNFPTRFIELKGFDGKEEKDCCKTRWGHAFHQLYSTYESLEMYMDLRKEFFIFVLCTSIRDERRAARYKSYAWYRKLRELPNASVKVLFRNDFETV